MEDKNWFNDMMEDPSDGFSKEIMNKLQTEENVLKKVVVEYGMESPSDVFLETVMQKVEKPRAKRILPFKLLAGAAAILVLVISGAFLSGSFSAEESVSTSFDWSKSLDNAQSAFSSSILLFSTIAIFLVISFDWWWSRRKLSS